MATGSALSEADLHGLVDGHIDADRRAEILRRAAGSPHDRARIEAWQDQNDLIRAAFADVEREPLPSALDLRMPPRLQAVPKTASPRAKALPPRGRRSTGWVTAVVAAAAGLAGSFYVATSGAPPPKAALVNPGAAGRAFDDGALVERTLADRTLSSLAFGEGDAFVPAVAAEPPAVATIPDLSSAGFAFTGAEARSVHPPSLVFRYRDGAGQRIAVGVARADGDDRAPAQRGGGLTWRTGQVAYALFGTVAFKQLQAVANVLRKENRAE